MLRLLLLLFRLGLVLAFLLTGPHSQAQSGPGQQFAKHFGAAEGLPQPFIYTVAQDRQGYLWIGTAEGLVRYDGTEFKTYTTKDGLAEDFVVGLNTDDRASPLVVLHYQGGQSLLTPKGFMRITPKEKGEKILPDSAWLAGLQRQYQAQLPAGAVIRCTEIDREGNLWLGTAGHGLWRFTDRHIKAYPQPVGTTWSAAGGPVLGLSGTADGRLTQPYSTEWLKALRLPALKVPITVVVEEPLAVGKDSRDSIKSWLGTRGRGVWQHRGQLLQPVAGLPSTLRVTALTRAPDGTLWVGTESDGVYRRPADPSQPTTHYTTANGLLHNTIYALLCDAAGRVWVATHGTGLAMWEQGRFRHFRLVPGGLNATALATDPAGRVWIGTEGSGLFCYEKGRFRQYTTAQGLASDYCYALALFRSTSGRHDMYSAYLGGTDYLLLVHRNQLSALNPTTGRVYPLSAPDNPWVRDCLPQATALFASNQLLVLTRTGMVTVGVSTRQWQPELPPPAVLVVQTEVDGAPAATDSLGRLSAMEHRLAFRFRGISLSQAAAVQYQYRLRGYDTVWSKPSSATEARFSRLGAGAYQFEARARRGEQGAWSAPVVVPFAVATPFWQTWWFAALSVLAAGAGVWAFVRGREAVLRQQKLQLETTVRERTQELRHQKAHIEDMNAELTVARDVAEASRKAKAQFLANMSHEIRTPMNAVIGLSHLLRQTPLTGEQSEYLEAVQSSSQNLLVIINDILDSSKIEAGKLTLEHTAFRLPELLRRVAGMFRFATDSKQLHFHLDLAPDVPAAVLGDPVRLSQVLVNLVGNAVKFTTSGGVTLRVSVPAELADNPAQPVVHFAVQDTGIGIPADKLEAVFEDFSQANTSTTRQFGGTGLGLSIARNLVELHGGQLGVDSAVGVGSTFHFSIAYEVADPATVPTEATLAVGRFEPALRVLVAEDNELNQLVARKTLEAWNVQVTIAANGCLAVEAAAAASFDAVLMDVQMPEMDGYEASRQLRLRFPDAGQFPIIGLTASALPEDRALALAAGMNDTLAKPFDPAALFARLAQHTGRPTTAAPLPTETAQAALPNDVPLPSPTTPLPDWTLLEELSGGNEAFMGQIIQTFLTQAPLLQQELAAALSAADHDTLARTAHKLKGQAAYFGVPPLHATLEQLEQQARQPAPTDALTAILDQLTQHLTDIYPLLTARLGPR